MISTHRCTCFSFSSVLLYSPHSAFILWGNLCRGLVQKKLEQLVESELLKITKYHTTTKIGSPKLNYNFFFHFTAQCDSVHTFAVDGRHCTSREGNYSVLWCLHTNYTNYQRYGFLKICLPSSLLSVMIPMLLIFLEGCAILCPGYRQIRSRWRRFLWWRG